MQSYFLLVMESPPIPSPPELLSCIHVFLARILFTLRHTHVLLLCVHLTFHHTLLSSKSYTPRINHTTFLLFFVTFIISPFDFSASPLVFISSFALFTSASDNCTSSMITFDFPSLPSFFVSETSADTFPSLEVIASTSPLLILGFFTRF
ncbi:hypothetical protein Droror1_Dr00025116 [Drosera rotundifolia]